MIPRSINKRVTTSIVDDWIIAGEEQQMCTQAKNLDHNFETDEKKDDNLDIRNKFIKEGINNIFYNKPKIIESERASSECVYRAPESLNLDLTTYLLELSEKGATPTIHICAYHVNSIHMLPFLEYFLFKSNKEEEEQFAFPSFEYDSTMNVMTKSVTLMQVLCLTYYKNAEYNYKGFMNDDNNIYLFFDCSNLKLDSYNMGRNNDLWLVAMDEIINQKQVCNFKINNKVVDFFKTNSNFLFLTDFAENVIEMPTIVYSGCSKEKLNFIATFGVPREEDDALMGKYYYFTDYQNAIKIYRIFNNNEDFGGLIRSAIFLGKTKVPLNHQHDEIDESRVTKDMLLNNYENDAGYKKIKMMLRISDRDGNWTKKYDSVFLGKLELDDGTIFNYYPLWIIKDWEQQIVLSSHIIDNNSLKNTDFFIL